jgi:uncharacterized protein with von Willebrand factor type A (vWA) domain
VTWSPPAILSMQAVETDLWDRREHQRTTKGMRRYGRARNALFKKARTGPDALVDAFMVLTKASPRLVAAREMQPSHYVNRMVIEELLGLSATRRLRAHTVGDPTQATLGCVELAPVLEAIFERLEMLRDLIAEVEAQLAEFRRLEHDVAALQEAFDSIVGADPSPEDIEAALAAADELREVNRRASEQGHRLDEKFEELQERLADESWDVRSALNEAVSGMADVGDDTAATARAWGLSAGELRQLSAAERLAVARQLNTERMRQIADIFGRIRNMSFMDASVALDSSHEEIVDLELGGDLGRLAPSELLLLGDPVTEMEFFARWSERELMQYAVQGHDNLGRGGIVICIDGSGSMSGAPEIWSKAVMLNLLHLARSQRREMHVIHFGGPGTFKHDAFEGPADFSATRIIEAAGAFYGGGTDFQTPMEEALKTLLAEHARTGATRADVVFVTDDECWVSEEFMANYLSEMQRIGARTYGLTMCGHRPYEEGALMTMCEGRVVTIEDLRSGKDVRSMLRQIR